MNAYIHSEISVKKRKGKIEDYYNLHDFSDCSKEIDSSQRHRLYFHNLWGIKNILIPIFGHTIINSDGIPCNVKDICEQDHCLPDFRGCFIPTLHDFVGCIDDIPGLDSILDKFLSDNDKYFIGHPGVKELILSPLWNSGKRKSLLITCNSWFLGHILPKIFTTFSMPIINFEIDPSLLFNNMTYKNWMSGEGVPPSCAKLYKEGQQKPKLIPWEEVEKYQKDPEKPEKQQDLKLPFPGNLYYDGLNLDINKDNQLTKEEEDTIKKFPLPNNKFYDGALPKQDKLGQHPYIISEPPFPQIEPEKLPFTD